MDGGEDGRTGPREAPAGMTVEEDPPETISRRSFVKAGVAVAVGAWAASFGGSLLKSATTRAEEEEGGLSREVFVYHVPAGEEPWYAALDGKEVLADEFPPMESAKVYVRGVKALLMRLDEPLLVDRAGSELGFVAFESKCTHLGCQVYFAKGKTPVGDHPEGIIYCPCHQGAFDPYRGAKVVSGPPPQPLPRIPLRVVNGRLEAE